jgi:hypothetical protein
VTSRRLWPSPRRPGVDLVEIVPNANPPVCKILDYGKFRFLEQKKAAEARKKQKIVEIKEIKLRPGIDDHDYDVKMKAVRRFFEEGDKVKVTLRFRGREMAHMDSAIAADEGARGNGHGRQGRGRALDGRPADDHGAGAALTRRHAGFCVSKPLPRQGLWLYKPPFDPPGE